MLDCIVVFEAIQQHFKIPNVVKMETYLQNLTYWPCYLSCLLSAFLVISLRFEMEFVSEKQMRLRLRKVLFYPKLH